MCECVCVCVCVCACVCERVCVPVSVSLHFPLDLDNLHFKGMWGFFHLSFGFSLSHSEVSLSPSLSSVCVLFTFMTRWLDLATRY